MRWMLSGIQGLGSGLLIVGLLDLVFGGWRLLALVVAVFGLVLVTAAFIGVGRWRRSGAERRERQLAAASELALARIDLSYPIRVRRPFGWTRFGVTVVSPNGEAYRTTFSQLFERGQGAPAAGTIIVVARSEGNRADVRWVLDPDASWQAQAADPAVLAMFPRRNAVRARTSWDTRMSREEQWRSWQAAFGVACGGLALLAAALLLGV